MLSEIDMAYMNQERKAIIAAALKPVLAKYGMKGSLSVNNYSTIVLTLSSGAVDFGDAKGVNVYWIDKHFEGVARDFLLEAMDAMKSAGWYNRSDIMTDYFDVAYYCEINLGKWKKPYVYSPIKAAA